MTTPTFEIGRRLSSVGAAAAAEYFFSRLLHFAGRGGIMPPTT